MNPETSIVCVDCGITYTMSDQEYQRFKVLAATVENFRMPRRCPDCRRVRRNQAPQPIKPQIPTYKPGQAQQVRPTAVASIAGVSVEPTPVPKMPAPVVVVEQEVDVEKKEEILFVLATKDFEELVHGRPILWRGVRVVLADIGFKAMRMAIDDAELERAKKHVKANGH